MKIGISSGELNIRLVETSNRPSASNGKQSTGKADLIPIDKSVLTIRSPLNTAVYTQALRRRSLSSSSISERSVNRDRSDSEMESDDSAKFNNVINSIISDARELDINKRRKIPTPPPPSGKSLDERSHNGMTDRGIGLHLMKGTGQETDHLRQGRKLRKTEIEHNWRK